MRPMLIACGFALALLASGIPATAEHTQAGVMFHHRGGNEWWVELETTGDDRHDAAYVRDTGGAWKLMEKPSWAPPNHYAVSYHVEPGHHVQFKVTNRFDEVVSCWFTHPDGMEMCDGTETDGLGFRVWGDRNSINVDLPGFEEEHMYAIVLDPTKHGGVLIMDDQLPNGSWTHSTYVPDNLRILFSAESAGQVRQSGCYSWPSVRLVPCPFGGFSGWMENVHPLDGNHAVIAGEAHYSGMDLAKAQVRFDGGEFVDMRAPDHPPFFHNADAPSTGTHAAEFRLVATDGSVQCDEVGYEWPQRGEYPFIVGEGGLVFAEPKGNANWVQINTYGGTGAVAVEASVNGGAWRPLTFQSWCDWAAPISAPDGSQVRFRAFYPNLTSVTSAPYAWPPGGGTGFDATFSGVKGNAWWIEAKVTANAAVTAVHASVNGGDWRPLTLRSWGAWAASFSIPEGSRVQLRATSSSGATDLSGCYRWVAATPVDCSGGGGGGTTFDATFKNVRGNQWWIETDVSATGGTLAGVDARVNGGAWIALEKKSYGSWAKSIHAPTGSTVEFRARAADGQSDVSSAYRWPPA